MTRTIIWRLTLVAALLAGAFGALGTNGHDAIEFMAMNPSFAHRSDAFLFGLAAAANALTWGTPILLVGGLVAWAFKPATAIKEH